MSFVSTMGQDFILKPPAAATQSFPRRSNNNLLLACRQLGSSLHIKEKKRANCMGISLIFAPKLGKNKRVETQVTSLHRVFPHCLAVSNFRSKSLRALTSKNSLWPAIQANTGEEEIRRNVLLNYCRLKEGV